MTDRNCKSQTGLPLLSTFLIWCFQKFMSFYSWCICAHVCHSVHRRSEENLWCWSLSSIVFETGLLLFAALYARLDCITFAASGDFSMPSILLQEFCNQRLVILCPALHRLWRSMFKSLLLCSKHLFTIYLPNLFLQF